MITTPVPKCNCLVCGFTFDAATSDPLNEDALPHPDALSICCECASVAMFTDDMQLRPLTKDEQTYVDNDLEIQFMRHAILKVRQTRMKGNA